MLHLQLSAQRIQVPVDRGDREGATVLTERNHAIAVGYAAGDVEAARAHIDAAGALFAQHGGARLHLDQVLAKKQFLKA